MFDPPNWTSLSLFLIFAALGLYYITLVYYVTTAHIGLNDKNLCTCFGSQIWELAWHAWEKMSYVEKS